MISKYKFRGKSLKTGEWVYGSLLKSILTMLIRLIVACLFLMTVIFVAYIFYLLVYLLVGIPLPTIQEVVVLTLLILGGFYCIDVAVDMVSEFIDFKV